MSQASDMLVEVKQLVADVSKEVKRLEGDLGDLGSFTDLAHLNIAKIHLGELLGKVKARRDHAEVTAEPEPAGPAGPAGESLSATVGMRPLADSDLAPAKGAGAEGAA